MSKKTQPLSPLEYDLREINHLITQPSHLQEVRIQYPGEHEHRTYAFNGKWEMKQDMELKNEVDDHVFHVLLKVKQQLLSSNIPAAIDLLDGVLKQKQTKPTVKEKPLDSCASVLQKETEKRKRQPNEYNTFVSMAMKMVLKEYSKFTSKDVMAIAVQMWAITKANPNIEIRACMQDAVRLYIEKSINKM